MTKFKLKLNKKFFTVLQPPKNLPCGDWAELHVRLPISVSNKPGKLKLQSWWREILNGIGTSKVLYRNIQSSAQQGKSLCMALALLFGLFHRGVPSFICFADESSAVRFFRRVLLPIVKNSPFLSEQVKWTKSNVNKYELITTSGIILRIAWASSASVLASTPAANIVLDEVCKYKDVIKSEASPISLAKARMLSYIKYSPTFICASTPTHSNSPLAKLMDESINNEWKFNCPGCKKLVGLSFSNLKWKEKTSIKEIESETVKIEYECNECQNRISESKFRKEVANGQWVEIPDLVKANPEDKTITEKSSISSGYYLSGLLSETVPWWNIVSNFMRIAGDFEKLRNWKNNLLGEHYEDERITVKDSTLNELEDKSLSEFVFPDDTITIVAGIDVGKKESEGEYHFWTSLVACQPANRYTVISVARCLGTKELLKYLSSECVSSDGLRILLPSDAYIDTGYDATTIYKICIDNPGIQAIKGNQSCFPPVKLTRIESTKQYGKDNYLSQPIMLGHVHTNHFKDIFYNLLQNKQMKFVSGLPPEVFLHIKNEVKKLVKNKLIYAPKYSGAQQHYLDTFIYAIAGAWLLGLWKYNTYQEFELANGNSSATTPSDWDISPQPGIKY